MENLNFTSRDFVHLHLHSDYSLLQSTIQLKHLAGRLAELEMKACAITDYANLYGVISFYNTMKAAGIRPILGYEAMLTFDSMRERNASVRPGEKPYYNLILLAKDFAGYQNLVHLASKAFTEGFQFKPRIDLELLSSKCSGLIALSGGPAGPIGHFLTREAEKQAEENAVRLNHLFGNGNFYLEIQDHGHSEDRILISRTAELAKRLNIPLVATNDPHYLNDSDERAQRVLVCIGEGKKLSEEAGKSNTRNRHVRSAEEMWSVFGTEFPDALNNSLRIAEECCVDIPMGDENLTLPNYPIPEGASESSTEEYFEKVIREGLAERKQEVLKPMQANGSLRHGLSDYDSRLETEAETIKKMGFASYFLIVWDFIKYARQKGIPVGPGRGSAAGSLAAYCMRITDVDPLQYDLLFERFLNPERISMPDIDIDFCIRGRGEVIDHVTEFYGRDSVCQIITFGTMASRAAIKDVGRALNIPYGDVEKIAKLIPPPVRGRNVSISQALQQVPELKKAVDSDPKVKDLVDLALRLEGCARHTSVHAAGVVISPRPLHELVPVAISSKNELTSQYTMNDLEKVGMLKMDFLALTTLTVISDCLGSIQRRTGEVIDWTRIPLNDEKTMAIFAEGRTEAIFQFESSGMQEICRRLKPKELEDLSALNALYRPGPLDGGMIDDYIARHRGEKPVRHLIPQMKEILGKTYGVLVYQEQIMQLAQKLAGFSLGEADMMRRAMGKKKREEMAKHEAKFVSGAVANGIKKQNAEEIFNLMSQFADYGFNRSHSIAYAYLAFQTAYLKAHYPSYFYAAVLSHESDDSAKVYKYSSELRSLGLDLLPPDINESDEGFTPLETSVRFGLAAIKGIGASTVGAVVSARQAGKFTSVFDFMSRVEPSSINRRGLESLIAAGAFDSLDHEGSNVNSWRAKLYSGVDALIQESQRAWNDKARGQSGLFGAAGDPAEAGIRLQLPDVRRWTQAEVSKQEKAAVGFYLSAHPLDEFVSALAHLNVTEIVDCNDAGPGQSVELAGIVSGAQVRFSKKGNRFCIFRLEDRSGGVKCIAWGESFSKFGDLLKDDELITVSGKVESGEGQDLTVIISEAKLLGDAVPANAREVRLKIGTEQLERVRLEEILSILTRDQGGCDVILELSLKDAVVSILSQPVKIRGSLAMQNELASRGCSVEWRH